MWAAALLLASAAAAGTALTAHAALAAQSQATPEPSRPSFAEFLDGVRQEALARGIKQEVLDAALADVQEPVASVIERDRTQAETVLSLEKYLSRLLTAKLIRTGREAFDRHRALIDEISDHYGVPP